MTNGVLWSSDLKFVVDIRSFFYFCANLKQLHHVISILKCFNYCSCVYVCRKQTFHGHYVEREEKENFR